MFNEQQKEVYEYATGRFMENDNEDRILGIYGAGGVGKSFLLKSLEKHYSVGYTAPTNQASSAFAMIGCKPDNCMTVFRMLGFSVSENESVTTVFKKSLPLYSRYKVVVVDEGSMVNEVISAELKKASRYVRIIISGDTHQALPVGLSHSPAFSLPTKHFTLTQQMRQKNIVGKINPLSELLNFLRFCISYNIEIDRQKMLEPSLAKTLEARKIKATDIDFNSFMAKNKSDGVVNGVSITSDAKAFEAWVRVGIERDFFAIAYHNATVDKLNVMSHSHKYNSGDFVVGQNIIFNALLKNGSGSYQNGEMVKIAKIEKKKFKVKFGLQVLTVDCITINNNITIFSDKEKFKVLLSVYGAECKKKSDGFLWTDYYKVKESFADISHCYAITAHKSQGVTRDCVAADIDDIVKSLASIDEKLRLIYTVVSRARNSVALKVSFAPKPNVWLKLFKAYNETKIHNNM